MKEIGFGRKRTDIKTAIQKYGFYIFFVILIAVFGALSPKFLTFNNIIGVLLQSASVGIAAAGMCFVLITGGIDLSAGSIIFFSATVCGALIGKEVSFAWVLLISVLCGALVGAINGLLIARFKMVPFISTLATMTACRGLTLCISEAKAQYLSGSLQNMIMNAKVLGIPAVVLAMLAVMLLGHIVLRYTPYGRQLYALGHNDAAASMIGIHVVRNKFFAYLLAGVTAGIAGLISAIRVGAVMPSLGQGQEFVIISSVVLGGVSLFGGKGNIFPGVFIGVLIISCIENGLVLINADPYLYTIVRGAVIFLSVLIDSIQNKGEAR